MRLAPQPQRLLTRAKPSSAVRRAALLLLLASAWTITALAHPLGNFTINHYARLEIGGQKINVRYVIDMAEIPTFQELQAITGKTDGSPTKAELETYVERMVA